MFRIPAKVRTQLLAGGRAETSRYVYWLHDCSDIVPGLVYCVRCKRSPKGWQVITSDPNEDSLLRRIF